MDKKKLAENLEQAWQYLTEATIKCNRAVKILDDNKQHSFAVSIMESAEEIYQEKEMLSRLIKGLKDSQQKEIRMKAQITYRNTYGTKRSYTVDIAKVQQELDELKECKLQVVRVKVSQ